MSNHTPVRAQGWPLGAPLSSTELGQLQDRLLKCPNGDDGSTHNGTVVLGGVQAQHITGKEAATTTAATAGPHSVTVSVNTANQHFITVPAFAGDQTLNITIDSPRTGDQGIVWVRKRNPASRLLTVTFVTGADVDVIDIASHETGVDNDAPADAVTEFFWECVNDPVLGNVVRVRNEGTRATAARRLPVQGLSGLFDPRLFAKDYPPADPDNDGAFIGSSASVVRSAVQFASGSGERTVEFWRSPGDASFIIESAIIRLNASPTQAGSAVDLLVFVDVQRNAGGAINNRWCTITKATLKASRFIANSYDKDVFLSSFGASAFEKDAGLDASGNISNGSEMVSVPHLAYDGRLMVGNVVTASDTFNPPQDLLYGLDDDDVVIPYPAAGGALPAGLTAGAKYFVVSAAPSSWKVSATLGGAAVDVTTTGTWPWYFAAHHEGVSIGQRGIAVGNAAARFSDTKFRVRAKTASGSNNWTLDATVSLQLRLIR